MDTRIVNYYLLCSVSLGRKKHLVNELPEEQIDLILGKESIEKFLRKQQNNYIANETFIGGGGSKPPDVKKNKSSNYRIVVI